jgi:hypothetical protein
MTHKPLLDALPELHVLAMARLVIVKGLRGGVIPAKTGTNCREKDKNVIEHRFSLVWQKETQVFPNHPQTERVYGPNLRPLVDPGRCKPGADLVIELLGDHPIEGHYEHIATTSVCAVRVEEPQNSPHEAKGLACTRTCLYADKGGADRN